MSAPSSAHVNKIVLTLLGHSSVCVDQGLSCKMMTHRVKVRIYIFKVTLFHSILFCHNSLSIHLQMSMSAWWLLSMEVCYVLTTVNVSILMAHTCVYVHQVMREYKESVNVCKE